MALNARFFDMDGMLAETKESDRLAFNRAFDTFGPDSCSDVDACRELLLVTCGEERIRHHMTSIGFDGELDVAAPPGCVY